MQGLVVQEQRLVRGRFLKGRKRGLAQAFQRVRSIGAASISHNAVVGRLAVDNVTDRNWASRVLKIR